MSMEGSEEKITDEDYLNSELARQQDDGKAWDRLIMTDIELARQLKSEDEELRQKVDHLWAHHMADHDSYGKGV